MPLSENPTKLSNATLQRLRPEVRVPTYDRTQLKQATVHIGVGGFHRAHQAVYLDDLLSSPEAERWGECGLGLLKSDDRMRDALRGQDTLYTVVERSSGVPAARVIGSMTGFLYAPEERETVLEKLAAPDTRIVSLTITEGGYFIDEGTGRFLDAHPEIVHDLEHTGEPVSALGYLAEALDRRRRRGLPPFTVMSCDNLQGNGHVIGRVLSAFAELRNPELRAWIERHVAFPNSMVDRITPATTARDIAFVRERFGLEDAWPVVTEPFKQWVIEDTFSNGRPRWEQAGAELVTDVAPYELMKMRLLNGSHLAMAYLGALMDFTFVHEILEDALMRNFIEAFMEEVTPVVPPIPGVSVAAYKLTLIERFSNPAINDQVTRICSEGSAKMPKWVLPSIAELLAEGRSIELTSFVVASWIFYLARGVSDSGKPLDIVDARAAELTTIAKSGGPDPAAVLSVHSIFGNMLPGHPTFLSHVQTAMQQLAQTGARGSVQHFLQSVKRAAY